MGDTVSSSPVFYLAQVQKEENQNRAGYLGDLWLT